MYPETMLGKIFGLIATYIGALIITYIFNKAAKILLRKKYNMKETAIRAFIYVGLLTFTVLFFIKIITYKSFSDSIIYSFLNFISIYAPCLLFYFIVDIKRAKTEEFDMSNISIYNETKKCPDCTEIIKLEARKCIFCGHVFNEDDLIKQIEKRRAEILEIGMARKGCIQCPRCGRWSVYKDYMPDGSIVDWCPHCEESLQNMDE